MFDCTHKKYRIVGFFNEEEGTYQEKDVCVNPKCNKVLRLANVTHFIHDENKIFNRFYWNKNKTDNLA